MMIGIRLPTCKILVVIMLVKFGNQERWRGWLSNLSFVVVTVVPWVALIWLMWPRN